MTHYSVLTVAGNYIANTLTAYNKKNNIVFWINPYHKKDVANIRYGDFVGVFLMGIGLIYVGEVIHEPYINSNIYVGGCKEAKINDVYSAYRSNKALESIGLTNTSSINDFTKLINNSFYSSKVFANYDNILNLCLRPVGLSGKFNMGIGQSIGNSNGRVTTINAHNFINPSNRKTIVYKRS